MKIDEMIRDASAELRSATENRPLPSPRFAASPAREKRRRWQLALAAVVALSVAALVVRAIDRNDPSQIDTVVPPSTTSPTTTVDSESPPIFPPPPANLPNYVGKPLSTLTDTLERWKIAYDLNVEPGVRDPSRGRIIDQQPGGGTPLAAGIRVTFRIGQPTAILDGEFEIGSGPSSKRGAWRVVASTNITDGERVYSMTFLTDESTMISSGNHFDSNVIQQYDQTALIGLVAGTVPASAVEVLLLDFRGNTVSSVRTTLSDNPRSAAVSFFLIESAKHPFYTSLAVDRDGNVVAELLGR